MPCFSGFQRMPSPLFVPWRLICKIHDEQCELLILPNLHTSMCSLPMQIELSFRMEWLWADIESVEWQLTVMFHWLFEGMCWYDFLLVCSLEPDMQTPWWTNVWHTFCHIGKIVGAQLVMKISVECVVEVAAGNNLLILLMLGRCWSWSGMLNGSMSNGAREV